MSREQVLSNCVGTTELDQLGLKPLAEWVVVTLKGRPGLYILPNLLRDDAVEMWLRRMFVYAEPPNITNLTAHGINFKRDLLKEAGKSLRWATLGVPYDWETKKYPLSGDRLPKELVITKVLSLGTMYADAAIVNYYPPKSTLSPHVDRYASFKFQTSRKNLVLFYSQLFSSQYLWLRSERTDAPLISLSLGQSAVYLSGGVSLDDDIVPLWLRSGDVLVMHGTQRFVYHAIAAICSDRRFTMEDPELGQFINSSRVNITIRQVNCTQ
ncbi:putative alkylated DNA repair protein AlkB [Dictyocaulus viviparus]|uniref:Putative alkylated DNA repair protein AlkB n=1 Tax=Dictyocaulus viviparus TaxID=29172 RepID=A0A0D8Y7K8_DICVI|nr:putative alkylated DNA repair protein AlkB [Dictyocaulus viviparus]